MTRHLSAITEDGTIAQRLITTDQPNTIFFDYLLPDNTNQRILITIHDAVHTEWSIKAHYTELGGEWHKVQGGGLADPQPVKLYEWEEELDQWILKEHYSSDNN